MKFFTHTLSFISLIFFLLSIAQIEKHMTQSEAHMSVPLYANMVQQWYNFDQNPYYKQLYDEVVQKERAYNDTHYVFYNGFTNEWRIPQDLYLKLFLRLHPLTIDYEKGLENFRAFRWMPVTHKMPEKFIKEQLMQHGIIKNNFEVRTYLLSTNLALFGNVGFPGECTFEYFVNSRSQTSPNDTIIKEILDIFDDPAQYKNNEKPILYKYMREIEKLIRYLQPIPLPNGKTPGTLSQIFVPKQIADRVAYISWVGGIPYEEKLVNWVLSSAQKTPGENVGIARTGPVLKEIQELFKDKKESHPLFKQILDGIEKGKYRISPLLEEYKTTPELIPDLNNIQGRLIISPEYIGNPSTNVNVFLYDRISLENKKKYETELDLIVDSIVSDILSRAAGQ